MSEPILDDLGATLVRFTCARSTTGTQIGRVAREILVRHDVGASPNSPPAPM